MSGLQCYLCASIRPSAIGTQNLSSPACNDTNFDPNLVPTQVPGNNISLLGTSLSASEFNCSACAVRICNSFHFITYTIIRLWPWGAVTSLIVRVACCLVWLLHGSRPWLILVDWQYNLNVWMETFCTTWTLSISTLTLYMYACEQVYRIPSFDFLARICYTTFNFTAAFPNQEVGSEFCQTDLCNGSPFVADENTNSDITPVTSSTTTTASPSGSGSSSAPSRHSATLTLQTVFLGLASLLLLALNY